MRLALFILIGLSVAARADLLALPPAPVAAAPIPMIVESDHLAIRMAGRGPLFLSIMRGADWRMGDARAERILALRDRYVRHRDQQKRMRGYAGGTP